jgi:hypothetical protein
MEIIGFFIIVAGATPFIFGVAFIVRFLRQGGFKAATKGAKRNLVIGLALILLVPFLFATQDVWVGANSVQQRYKNFRSERQLTNLTDKYFQPSAEYRLVMQHYGYYNDLPGAESQGKSLMSDYTFEDEEYTLQQYVGSADEIDMCGDKPQVLSAGGGSTSIRHCEYMPSKFGDIRVDMAGRQAEIKTAGKAIYVSTSQYHDTESDVQDLIRFVDSLKEVPSSEIKIKLSSN